MCELQTNKKLLLSFDINKTILISDRAGGKCEKQTVNVILSSKTYGTIVNDQWIWDQQPPTTIHPPNKEIKINYYDFLNTKFKDKHGEDLQKLKNIRDQLMGTFTDENQPGEGLKSYFEHILSNLLLPQQYSIGIKSEISGLHQRTFGDDLIEIVKEFNAFCEGHHPIFETNSFQEYKINLNQNEDLATFFRCQQGDYLILKTTDQPKNYEDFQQQFVLKYQIIQGIKNIYDYTKQKKVMFIRDYYYFWRQNLEQGQFGKIFPIDQLDQQTVSLFFDDNIGRKKPRIVDARDVDSEEPIQFEKIKHKNLIKVEPYEAMLQPDYYFINLINRALNLNL